MAAIAFHYSPDCSVKEVWEKPIGDDLFAFDHLARLHDWPHVKGSVEWGAGLVEVSVNDE